MLPRAQRGQNGHILRSELVTPWHKYVGKLSFVDKYRHLRLTHGELSSIFNGIIATREFP